MASIKRVAVVLFLLFGLTIGKNRQIKFLVFFLLLLNLKHDFHSFTGDDYATCVARCAAHKGDGGDELLYRIAGDNPNLSVETLSGTMELEAKTGSDCTWEDYPDC